MRTKVLAFLVGAFSGMLLGYLFSSQNNNIVLGGADANTKPSLISNKKTNPSREPLKLKLPQSNNESKAIAVNPAADSFISFPAEFIGSLRIYAVRAASDELNREAFTKLGLSQEQIDNVSSVFHEAIQQIAENERKNTSLEAQDDGSNILTINLHNQEAKTIMAAFTEKLRAIVPDGRADIIYSNLASSQPIGYEKESVKEIKLIGVERPDGTTSEEILDNRVSTDPDTGVKINIGNSIDKKYFYKRYGNLLDSLKLNSRLMPIDN